MTAGSEMSSEYDVVIIGTGLYGIQAARYYLEIHPEAKVMLLESDDVIGGTWSSKSYVDDHIYSGRSIRDRIMFQTTVNSITRFEQSEKEDDHHLGAMQWTVTCNTGSQIHTSKLIDATGMTSQPEIPTLPTIPGFKGKILHHKSFGQEENTLRSDPSVQNVCIIGGAKSAADVAYAFAKAPAAKKNIDWIIRESGNGPSAFFGAESVDPRYANSNEGFYNRYMAGFLPNYFGRWALWKWLLQWTFFGRRHVRKLWAGFDHGLRGVNNFRREGRAIGFANLEPDTPIFWQNDSSGVANRPDYLSTLATKVRIWRRDIALVTTDSIVLKPRPENWGKESALTIPVDALIYCTGWSPVSNILTPRQASELGLPVPCDDADPQVQKYWESLESAADPLVLSRFPILRHPPAYRKIEPKHTPYRLYQSMAPPSDIHSTHSIVFLGRLVVGNNFCTAEAQAIWAVAYLDGQIKHLPSQAQIEREVAETVAWDRRRYLNKGELGTWFYFDVVDYCDGLLEQLGLKSHRKGKGWFAELRDPFFAKDLKGLVEEYKGKYQSSRGWTVWKAFGMMKEKMA
ncbi:MAG: hypothetical protein Q9219_007105 [cf. Caloplaca sp. 3 TL-2023]